MLLKEVTVAILLFSSIAFSSAYDAEKIAERIKEVLQKDVDGFYQIGSLTSAENRKIMKKLLPKRVYKSFMKIYKTNEELDKAHKLSSKKKRKFQFEEGISGTTKISCKPDNAVTTLANICFLNVCLQISFKQQNLLLCQGI